MNTQQIKGLCGCIIGAGLVFISYGIYQNITGSQEVVALHDAIKRQLKDPESAQFRNIMLTRQDNGLACGEVNSKNSLGGYVGFHPFVRKKGDQLKNEGYIFDNPRYALYDEDFKKCVAVGRKI